MNTIRYFFTRCFVSAVLLLLLLSVSPAMPQERTAQDDPVLAPEAGAVPVIDGIGGDSCWQNISWQPINEVWMPYGATVDTNDYSGRYKVVWSASTNLLYFLVDVTDDVFVDGFIPGVTSDIYNYDIAEVFIDEDKSGGKHVFDGTGEVGREFGTKAANAFSYHIYMPFPREGEVSTDVYAGDLTGTDWADARYPNYASHLPEFAMRVHGHEVVREFSLIVYNDTYSEKNKESARSKLAAGKIMGLSLAVCDNDHPEKEPKLREKFFGSVRVPAEANNEHWRNADYFGTVKLLPRIK
jgi:hypothetical protein